MRAGILIVMLLSLPATAQATLRVFAADRAGAPVANAVVGVSVTGAPRASTAHATMRQHGKSFSPKVLVVPAGTVVRFPNDDPFLHHVYSFSPAKTFELDLYSREQEPEVRFDAAGVVVVGCNIHDEMRGYIYVTDATHFGVTGADGMATLSGVPPGVHQATAWHARLGADAGPGVQVTVEAGAGDVARIVLDLRPERTRALDPYERGDYE